ncbi:MAG: isoprenylcysteine carboxylmethyltransferase family protein [Patescibacteria group bacterium]
MPMNTIYVQYANITWVVIFVVWVIGFFGNKKTAKLRYPLEQVVVFLLLVASFILLFDWPLFHGWLALRLVSQTEIGGILGVALAYAGAACAIWARISLGKNWSGAVVTVKENHELIKKDPYAYIRHPIYTGYLATALGCALTVGTVGPLLGVVVMLLAFAIRIRREELLMTQQFPNDYPAYKKTSKMLVPFLF